MRMLRFALAAGVLAAAAPALAGVTLRDVHGLAYSPDGKQLIVAVHDGLVVYESGKWSKFPAPQHDYMGFSASSKHFYSSGHPAPRSGLVNPLGLVRSKDGGKTWEKLGLEGEADFHLLATSRNASAIYVWNHAPNSRMRQRGLHFTVNDGFIWKQARAEGVKGDPAALAVHPANGTVVALATSSGVFVSRDSGGRFEPVASGVQGVSVFFDLDGRQLWYGTFDGQARLARAPLGGKATSVELPAIGRDAVAYIAQNPGNRAEYAIATFERSVYLSKDAGRSWSPIAVRGNGD
jgi:hypothetical protein